MLRLARACVRAIGAAGQPSSDGRKPFHRLQQLLKRVEWTDSELAEGLLLNGRGQVVSAIMGNLFGLIVGIVWAPSLNVSGVAGVACDDSLAHRPRG